MMKGDFEVYCALGLVQPNEYWDYNPIGFSTALLPCTDDHISMNHFSLSKPLMVDGDYYVTSTTTTEAAAAAVELSEFMDYVAKQQYYSDTSGESTATAAAATATDGFSMESISMETTATYAPPPSREYPPNKSVRKKYNNGEDLELHWNNGLVAPAEASLIENGWRRNEQVLSSSTDEHGLGLLTLLLESAIAISVDNLDEANQILLELTQISSPYAPSCAERVVAYFAKAMASRVMSSWLGVSTPLVSHNAINGAFQIYNNISPFIKFAHLTSNQAILETVHQKDRVHIIDLDIMQGLQWPALFHVLATRIEGPPHVRLTGMGSSMETLEETGRQLSKFARRMGLSFEFNPIAKKFSDMVDQDFSAIQKRRGETVAVHWLQHSLYDATGTDWKTLRLLELIAPDVITVVEQDMAGTGPTGSFMDRFVGCLNYYSTIFDSLGASLSCDDVDRHSVEHCLLSREIANVLAVGGSARSREEKFSDSWRLELARRGFLQVPMSSNSTAQAQIVLRMFLPSHGYTLRQGDGMLRLGWKDTILCTASAWTSHHFSSFSRHIVDVDSYSGHFNIHPVINGLM